MVNLPARKITAGLSEYFASAWALLSDTDDYLSRTSVFHQYEADLKRLRSELSAASRDSSAQRDIRDRIVQLRRALRLQGYDLTLSGFDLEIRGFRNDAAVAEGFRRLVIVADRKRIVVLAGQDNHMELYAYLEEHSPRSGFGPEALPHFLWYRWTRKTLELSGADSEPKENFEKFKEYCAVPENRLRIIASMKKIH